MKVMRVGAIATLAVLVLTLSASNEVAEAHVPTGTPTFSDPLDIDNPWHPFVVNRIRVYELLNGEEDLTVIDVFTSQTRTFAWNGGEVECRCLQEWEIEDGEVIEISLNYFAQADDGTVYYFGETVDEYEDGEIVSHGGSWLVGGGQEGDPEGTLETDDPTIFMPRHPRRGDVWKPEDIPEEDLEEFNYVRGFRLLMKTPAGWFFFILKIREETPDVEHKFYALDVGFIAQVEDGEVLAITDILDHDDDEELEEALEEIVEDATGDDEE